MKQEHAWRAFWSHKLALSFLALFLGSSCDNTPQTFTILAGVETTYLSVGGERGDDIPCPALQVLFGPFMAFVHVECDDQFHVGYSFSTEGEATSPTSNLFLNEFTQIGVGFESYYYPGTDPCPCWSWASFAYRGQFGFNLNNLPGKHSILKHIIQAYLVFTFEESEASGGDVVSGDADVLSGIYLRIPPSAKSSGKFFSKGSGVKTVTEDFLVPFPKLADIGQKFPKNGFQIRRQGNTVYIDISNQVRKWIAAKETNLGMLMVGRDESLPFQVNSVNLAKIGHIHLEILTNPNQ